MEQLFDVLSRCPLFEGLDRADMAGVLGCLGGKTVEVGRGEREADSIPALFGAKREQAGFLAPAQGLCLEEVVY